MGIGTSAGRADRGLASQEHAKWTATDRPVLVRTIARQPSPPQSHVVWHVEWRRLSLLESA
jgi:hypothetical protein